MAKTFVIEAPSNSRENLYLQKATLNGKKHEQNWISHEDILKGGKLKFEMGAKPDTSRGTQESAAPYSFTNDHTATQHLK
ncbi:alpha-1,2-mannosidase [Pontibacter sp. BAB1700]|nr:alpha-1,2-mannosidase [Pontibacter sp. BAB1700]